MFEKLAGPVIAAGAVSCLLAQAPMYVLQTAAGVYPLGDGGPALSAMLENPSTAVKDKDGNLYVLDQSNFRIRRIAPNGIIGTLATASGTDAAVDRNGNLLVASSSQILRVTPSGQVQVVGGTGRFASAGNGQPATAADMAPTGIALAADGTIYFTESNFHTVRKIGTDGIVSAVAGATGSSGFVDNVPAGQARLNFPQKIAVDSAGNLLFADGNNRRIRKITFPAGTISTVAGNGNFGPPSAGVRATASAMGTPWGIALDSQDRLYWTDYTYSYALAMGGDGNIQIVAGAGDSGFSGDGGLARAAKLANPSGVLVDAQGTVFISDTSNHRIRRVGSDGIVTTIAGRSHYSGDGGPAKEAVLFRPSHAAVASDGSIFVSDTFNHRIRRVSPDGVITTTGGTGTAGFSGDRGRATAATLNSPGTIAIDPAGNLLVADRLNRRLRRINTDGTIETIAGTGNFGDSGDGGPAVRADFRGIDGLALAPNGTIFIADGSSSKVRAIDPAGSIRTYAGTGTRGFSGDGGLATAAALSSPSDLAVDSSGNLLIAEVGNIRIRRVTPAGIIGTLYGNGAFGLPAEGSTVGAGTPFFQASGMAFDSAGNLYLGNRNYSRVQRITPGGQIATIAGSGAFDPGGSVRENAPATTQSLTGVAGVTIDRAGDLYVAASGMHRIVKLRSNTPARLEIAGGNGQTGSVGQGLPEALRVRVIGRADAAVPNVAVAFTVVSGAAAVSTDNTQTGADGVAGVGLTFGDTPGAVVVRASVAGVPTVDFNVSSTLPSTGSGATVPEISGISGSPWTSPPVTEVSVNATVTVSGRYFAAEGTNTAANPIAGTRLATTVAGTCVELGATRAPLLRVTSSAISLVVPELQGSEVDVTVIAGCDGPNPARSNAYRVSVKPATPEWQYLVRAEDGRHPIDATNAAGRAVAPNGALPGVETAAAKPDDVITAKGTGFGATEPMATPGLVASEAAALAAQAVIEIAGRTLPAESITYVGLAVGSVGGYQAVFRVPADLEDGYHPVVLKIGEARTSPAYLTVRRE